MLDALAKKDGELRTQALNPNESFLVQAPAGSGKTELLSQRYLSLLAHVDQPEEIIALSFTKKSAAEMKHRIQQALIDANDNRPIKLPHLQVTRELALKALEHGREWGLIANTQRMQITTLDSLSHRICRSIPILSHAGGSCHINDSAQQLYQQAVKQLLKKADKPEIERLLLHVDNNLQTIEQLLVFMLAKREQWLPFITMDNSDKQKFRSYLEENLVAVTKYFQQQIIDIMGFDQIEKCLSIIIHAKQYIDDQEHPFHSVNDLFIDIDQAKAEPWMAIVMLLLTPAGGWRKQFNIRLGFNKDDPKSMDDKSWLLDIIEQHIDDLSLADLLIQMRILNDIKYSDNQWQILSDLIDILPYLVAELHLLFRNHQAVDFNEINLNAVYALGALGSDTDIACYLNHSIKHILIDEFQDTSNLHFKIIEMLVDNWEENDGRSLFFVGDPQQSIYRFRQANVSLFLKLKKEGIGAYHPKYICLRKNFRSDKNLVDQFNEYFKSIFGSQENIDLGAVSYQESIATQSNKMATGLHLYGMNEATLLSDRLLEAISSCSNGSIAILIRSRNHLPQLIECLQRAGIAYQAHEMERLSQSQIVEDLIALTLALHQPGNRMLWASLLRAPWCGLVLEDLLALSEFDPNNSFFYALQHIDDIPLSKDGRSRLSEIAPILNHAVRNVNKINTKHWVESTWRALKGHQLIAQSCDYDNCLLFFTALDQLSGETITANRLIEELSHTHCQTESSRNNCIQIMTIHKSKGLEFDHVILTHLDKSTGKDPSSLLRWDNIMINAIPRMLFAPIQATGGDNDPIYSLIKYRENKKNHFENKRLLYVAMTRARQSLHLIYQLDKSTKKSDLYKEPKKNCFLYMLFKAKPYDFEQGMNRPIKHYDKDYKLLEKDDLKSYFRLKLNHIGRLKAKVSSAKEQINPSDYVDYLLNYEQQQLGKLIHYALEVISIDGIDSWNESRLNLAQVKWKFFLRQMGVTNKVINFLSYQCHECLINLRHDPRAQWILNPNHVDAQSEYALSYMKGRHHKKIIIDRCFIDNNKQWIIDYKCSQPQYDEDQSIFIEKQAEKHWAQLSKYRYILDQISDQPIEVALYFPLIRQWYHYDWKKWQLKEK